MQPTSSLPALTFFMFITSASIGSMLASTATVPLPPPPPSSGPGAQKCPDTITSTKVGQLLRSGERAGVITRKEGLTEEEVVSAMMSQKTPQKTESSSSKPAPKKMATGSKTQEQMMEELNKKLTLRQSGSSLQKPTGQTPEERSLRQSSPGRLEITPSTQPEADKPAWMKNLKRKSASTGTPPPSTNANDQPEEDPTNWRARLRKSAPENK